MLRITTDRSTRLLTFRLEGRLEGPWVEVLDECWRNSLNGSAIRRCIDLNGVTFIDAAGKARLEELHKQGAELITDDLMIKAIVAEIFGQ